MIATGSTVPLFAVPLALMAATVARRVLPPHVAARFLAVTMAVAATVVLPIVALLAAAYLVHLPVLGGAFRWCSMQVGIHGTIAWWIGLPAVVMLAVGAVRVVRVLRDHRRHLCSESNGVHVVDAVEPYAVTLPGRGGQVVVSSGLLDVLDEHETRVVLAHERAHATLRHDRFLLLAAVTSAMLPPLVVLARPLRFSLERWADEVAARRCGDRRLVAETLGRVALFGHPSLSVAGIGGAGVTGRVAALLRPPQRSPHRVVVASVWGLLVVTGALSVHLMQHLEPLLGALCRH